MRWCCYHKCMSNRVSELQSSIQRVRERLNAFESRYHVDTPYFLQSMAAEDLVGGDLEYVEWAGYAEVLEGLEAELHVLAEK